MVLETHIHMKLPVTEWDFLEEYFLLQKLEKVGKMDQKLPKNRVFLIYWKIWSLVFTGFVL